MIEKTRNSFLCLGYYQAVIKGYRFGKLSVSKKKAFHLVGTFDITKITALLSVLYIPQGHHTGIAFGTSESSSHGVVMGSPNVQMENTIYFSEGKNAYNSAIVTGSYLIS